MPYGLNTADWKTYLSELDGDSVARVEIHLMDLNHQHIANIKPIGLDGQVNIDYSAEVDRTLQLGLLDPDHALHVDSAAPTDGAIGLNRLVQIRQGLDVKALGRTVWVESFTGRPSTIKRDGDTITLEAQGKECLHLRGVPHGTIPKGAYVVDVIRNGLLAAGETHISIPSRSVVVAKVPVKTPIGGTDENLQPWKVWKRLAAAAGCQLYVNGAGFFCLRWVPKTSWTPVHTLTTDNIMGRVGVTTDLSTIKNRIQVIPKKGIAHGVAVPEVSHPHSGWNLRIGGKSWYNTEYVENTAIASKAAASAYAKRLLDDRLVEQIQVELSCRPWWHGNPRDIVSVKHPDGTFVFGYSTASIPIMSGAGGEMSMGQLRRVRNPNAGRIGGRR